MLTRVLRWSFPPILCVAAMSAGCGARVCVGTHCGTKTLNARNIETKARAAISNQTGADVKSVACPAQIIAKKGATFNCTLKGADGTVATLPATQISDTSVYMSAPFLWYSGLAAQAIQQRVTKSTGMTVHVKCPDLVEFHKGATLLCRLHETSGREREVAVTITDDQGHFRYRVR